MLRLPETATVPVVRALLCLPLLLAPAAGALAQAPPSSGLAGIAFPDPPRNWNADSDGSKGSEIDLAAAVTARSCGPREYSLWPARDANAANAVRDRVDAALRDGGWRLDPVSRNDDGRRIYLATRQGSQLVVVWLPSDQGMGLLLCVAQRLDGEQNPAAQAGSGAEAAPPAAGTTAGASSGAPAEADAPPAATTPPVAENAPATTPPPAADSGETAAPADGSAPPDGGQTVTAGKADREAPAIAGPPSDRVGPAPVVNPSPPEPAPAAAAGDPWLRLLAWLAALILAAAGAVLVIRSIRARQEEREVGWPTTTAEVLESGVAERDDGNGEGVGYQPVVVYRYVVEGTPHEGSQIRPDDAPEDSYEAAEAIAARYPVGTEIEIRYHPLDPSSALIETDRKGLEIGLGIGAACLVLALAVFFVFG